jgi:iron(III) transport system substrate-binding protein
MHTRNSPGIGILTIVAGLLATPVVAQEINIYSARHYDSDEALYAAFTERTGIKINLLEADSDQLIERIRREGEASPADVLITVDAGRLWRAEEAGLFAPVDSDVLERRIPAQLRHPDGLWFGFSMRRRAIFYNKEALEPGTITTYEELADPRLRGEICIRSSSNVYNQSLVAAMLAAHGPEKTLEWAEGLVANLARAPQGGDRDQISGAAAGECQVAVANHYYYVRMLTSDNPEERAAAEAVQIVFPNQNDRGAHANVGGAGVVRGAPNHDNAVRFLEFLASDEAQALFASGNFEFPAVAGAKLHPEIEQWAEVKVDDLNIAVLGHNNAEAVRIMDRAGWR